MNILFRQKNSADAEIRSILSDHGIEQCMLKYISFEKDRTHITRKRHYHTNVEIHIIEKGYQIYEIGGQTACLRAGQFLIIPPLEEHIASEDDPRTLKHAITFRTSDNGAFSALSSHPFSFFIGSTPQIVTESLSCIREESRAQDKLCSSLISCRVLECIIRLYRLTGLGLVCAEESSALEENDRILLAKQYIEDNICGGISLSELASYCCISEKQLQRIFAREYGTTVMEYVRKRRCIKIEQLIAESSLSLRRISETMGFSSEYHFNAFFKKYAGMTPGAYKKTVVKK